MFIRSESGKNNTMNRTSNSTLIMDLNYDNSYKLTRNRPTILSATESHQHVPF